MPGCERARERFQGLYLGVLAGGYSGAETRDAGPQIGHGCIEICQAGIKVFTEMLHACTEILRDRTECRHIGLDSCEGPGARLLLVGCSFDLAFTGGKLRPHFVGTDYQFFDLGMRDLRILPDFLDLIADHSLNITSEPFAKHELMLGSRCRHRQGVFKALAGNVEFEKQVVSVDGKRRCSKRWRRRDRDLWPATGISFVTEAWPFPEPVATTAGRARTDVFRLVPFSLSAEYLFCL